MAAEEDKNRSVIGRLLEELSWVGSTIRHYRKGGRGYENVLTAEVLLALDFLPRRAFFGRVIEGSVGAAEARAALLSTIEDAEITLLPGNHRLVEGVDVQPDGIIESSGTYVLVEAKRIKPSVFQAQQLAREYLLLLRDAKRKRKKPLLKLILGQPPPVRVKGHGKLEIKDALLKNLNVVHANESEALGFTADEAIEAIDEVVCWTTWGRISEAIQVSRAEFKGGEASIERSITRLASSAISAIAWHSK